MGRQFVICQAYYKAVFPFWTVFDCSRVFASLPPTMRWTLRILASLVLPAVTVAERGFLSSMEAPSFKVTLDVFSSVPNPSWELEGAESARLLELLEAHPKKGAQGSYRVVGYSGFEVSPAGTAASWKLRHQPEIEDFLLESGRATLPADIFSYVKEVLKGNALADKSSCSLSGQCGFDAAASVWRAPCCEGYSCFCFSEHDCKCVSDAPGEANGDVDCNATPIRGPDTVPDFDLANDVGGCFLEKQLQNNCYNYGTDILTDTFAQPGKATLHAVYDTACNSVARLAIS